MKMVCRARKTYLETLIVTIFWIALPLLFFTVESVQRVCPVRCLCYLDRQPSTVICSKQGLHEFPEGISDVVEHLDLSGNLMEKIPNEVNQLTELKYLNLARNQLNVLPSELRGLAKLERLDLAGNDIKDVASIASVEHLIGLLVLYLSNNPMSELRGLKSGSLQALDASRCVIREMDEAFLKDLPSLTTLSLAENPLRTVQRPSSDKLRWLDLSDCQINYLNPDAFQGLPKLEELRLANNPTLVYSTRYDTLTHDNLKKLDVSRCNLDRPGLHGLSSLTHVKLSRNLIRILPDRIFAKNKELVQLSLSANGLNQLNRSSFAGLIKLEVLDLSSNALQEIHTASFLENVELRLLNLSYNGLFEFPNLTTATTVLDVSSNLIYNFRNNVLRNMPRIRSLDLSNNRLENIPDDLESLSLKILHLWKNRLTRLTNRSLIKLPALRILDLSGNRLTEGIDLDVFQSNENLQTIFLGDNPWRCDCDQLRTVYEYLTELPAKMNTEDLICQSPGNVSGFSWKNACYDTWNGTVFKGKDRTWGFVLITLLFMVIIFGSVISLKHAMKMKRQAQVERQDLERAEARERLRLLQRRNQRLEEELLEETTDPRIHPLELLGPPSYEEAVHMPRLVHSMDNLDEISMENVPVHVIGSMDSLRIKKRRIPRRPRKRTLSEEYLARREERREERRRRRESLDMNDPTSVPGDSTQIITESTSRTSLTRGGRRRGRSASEEVEDNGTREGRPRPQTPTARLKKRNKKLPKDGHSTDDEDSDVEDVRRRTIFDASSEPIVIQNLSKEPRSGFRPSTQESDF